MADPNEASLEEERDADKFEQLLEQLDRMSRDKNLPKHKREKDADGHG